MRLRIKRQSKLSPSHDWSSISDIGREFDGKLLSRGQYLEVEKLMVDFVTSCLGAFLPLEVRALENQNNNIIGWQSGMCVVSKTELEQVTIDCLREQYWCKLEDEKTYLHFGYDTEIENHVPETPTVPDGLRVEEMESPYS